MPRELQNPWAHAPMPPPVRATAGGHDRCRATTYGGNARNRRSRGHRRLPADPAGLPRRLSHDQRAGDVLYVGKAKNLRKRVVSYTKLARQANRLRRMVSETASMEFVTTPYRGRGAAARGQPDQAPEAALQYPAARRQVVPGHPGHRRPRVPPGPQAPRSARAARATISVPSPRPGAVNETLATLQRAFLAALLHRCRLRRPYAALPASPDQALHAPCVGRIDAASYNALVEQARAFLTGGTQAIQRELSPGTCRRPATGWSSRRPPSSATCIQAPDPGAGPPGRTNLRAWHRRRHRRPPGGRPDLHPGVLHPRRQQLRQPRLFPQPRQGRGA